MRKKVKRRRRRRNMGKRKGKRRRKKRGKKKRGREGKEGTGLLNVDKEIKGENECDRRGNRARI